MNSVSIGLMFLCILIAFGASKCNPTQFTDDVSINCGASGTSAARDGWEWRGDVRPKSSSVLQMEGSSTASNSMDKLISMDDPVPYETARLSRSQFSYTLQVSPGQKILRLHFYPASYKGFERLNDLFVVEAGPFILLSNFSASITASALGVRSFLKEYCINVEENQQFNVVFTAESSQSLRNYAFVNGIEIISVPTSLSYFHTGDIGVPLIGKSVVYGDALVYDDSSIALEVVHRQIIRKHSVLLDGDIHDLLGKWDAVPNQEASKTYSSTWKISVDIGFRYLVRIYFFDLAFKIADVGEVMSFEIRINDMIVNSYIDTTGERGNENGMPLYRDYVVIIKGRKHQGKHDLSISLNSSAGVIDEQGPLKGFEIMKLSNLENSLASPNSLPTAQDLSYPAIHDPLQVLGARNMIAIVSITSLALGSFVLYTLQRVWANNTVKVEIMPSARAQKLCRRFSLAEIRRATKNLSDENLIGKGGFGKVYNGLIDNEEKAVAIKQLKPNSKQGSREFLNEIEILTKYRHDNLVSLIGYCNENGEMMLVYEFMGCRAVANHLYKRSSNNNDSSFNKICGAAGRAPLTWKQRLSICIGAGRGLDYLHRHSLIHRDVNASNILLDENLKAKISDLGLVKRLSRSKLQSHVKTEVRGTRQYTDPSYAITGVLTQKSDVYSFGVFLLELLSGRPAVDQTLGDNDWCLVPWARENFSEGNFDTMVASNLRYEISDDSLKAYVGIAERCLDGEPKKRPTMAQVVLQLEFALEQQESSECLVPSWLTSGVDDIHPPNDTSSMS